MDNTLIVPPLDQFHASAIKFLIDEGAEKAASVLLSCSIIEVTYLPIKALHKTPMPGPEDVPLAGFLFITVRAPHRSYLSIKKAKYNEAPSPEEAEIVSQIEHAFEAVLLDDISVLIDVRPELIKINPQWRQELADTLFKTNTHNQGLPFAEGKPLHTWKNLRFRSQTEIRVAEALERAQVLFLPNCMARLGFSQRQNREADFLVCHKGKWGILEVDSLSSHPPTRTVEDHERDRLFKAHGIRVVEHFDAGECWEDADGVVKRFLYLLRQ